MKSCLPYFVSVASLLIASVLPASAGSTKTYTYSDPVTGITGIAGVSTSFTFNSKTDKVSAGTLTFTGAFGTLKLTFSGLANCTGGSCVFDLKKKVTYNGFTYTITDVISLSQLSAVGSIWNGKTGKRSQTGAFDGPFSSVPEGGSRFSYLAPAGFVIFSGMFLTGLLRPRAGRQGND